MVHHTILLLGGYSRRLPQMPAAHVLEVYMHHRHLPKVAVLHVPSVGRAPALLVL